MLLCGKNKLNCILLAFAYHPIHEIQDTTILQFKWNSMSPGLLVTERQAARVGRVVALASAIPFVLHM